MEMREIELINIDSTTNIDPQLLNQSPAFSYERDQEIFDRTVVLSKTTGQRVQMIRGLEDGRITYLIGDQKLREKPYTSSGNKSKTLRP